MRVGVIMYQTSLTKGQELVAQRMVKEFRRQGQEAYLITSIFHDQETVVQGEEVERQGGYVSSFDEKLGIPVVRVKSHKENWPPRRITFDDFVSNLEKIVDDLGLDVLITHSTLWNGPEETAKFVEWRRNQAKVGAPIRHLVFCHMSHFQEPSDERYDLPERTFRETWNTTILRMVTRLADFVLVTTPYEKEQMRKLGVGDEKFVLFPGGIDSSSQEFDRVEFRRKYGIPEKPKLVTYLGTVEERKNVAKVLEVAEALGNRPDVYFVIGGKLDGNYGEEMKAASADQSNASLIGPVPEEDYPELIKESYLNINMSRSEALGLVQLEFMFNGVPVVTSGVGGQSWIVKDGTSGVVLGGPDDVAGAAAAISKLAESRKRRDRLGMKSREIASQFTMPALIRDLAHSISLKFEGTSVTEAFEPGEKVVEAWAKKGYRVWVTTRKLVIGTTKGGQTTVIPFADITKVHRRLKLRWRVLVAGTLASLALFAAQMIDPSGAAAVRSLLSSWTTFLPEVVGWSITLSLATLPLALCLALVLRGARRGYGVMYGPEKEAFIPAEFAKALRIGQQLVPGRFAFMEKAQ